MEAPDVFLSYSRDDQATARKFADALASAGLNVWWDQTLRSGDVYDQVTESALRHARAVVVLWSQKSAASRWVRSEATLADRKGTLVPVMIEPCERPIMFELTQTADLSGWKGDQAAPGWRAFLEDVRRFTNSADARETKEPAAHVPPVLPKTPARDAMPALAVLPFTNRSGDPEDDVFAEGMEEDLVAALSLSSGIRIIARSATIGYRGNVSDLRKIGRELGVRYLLEGNVRRVGANLRVTAQLVEAEDGAILWLERFDRPLSELGTLQEQLVLDVTRHLGVQVGQAEMERALAKPGDISAWEAVMRARATMPDGLVIGGNDRAVVEARKAVTIAPDFALGHATLALVLVQNYIATGRNDPGLAREGREHAERALQLSPNDAQVLAASAIALGHVVGWSETLRYGERALRLNPNNFFALVGLTLASIHFNRPEEAIRYASAVELVAPRGRMNFAALGMKGLANFQRGHIEEALAAIDEALVMNPRFEQAFKDRAVFLAKLGREAEARQMIDRLRQSHPQLTIAQLESYNINSFFPAELAAEMNSILRRLWTAEDALP